MHVAVAITVAVFAPVAVCVTGAVRVALAGAVSGVGAAGAADPFPDREATRDATATGPAAAE